ncbi:MAG: toprim domain-containing protein [Bacteroidales bacterium]|nr:toprim domain-containing protein [Bacteroidales bacterium]
MISINGEFYDVDLMTILNDLYSQTSLGLNIRKDCGDNIMVQCPFHKNGEEKSPSCGIHKETGLYHCFACGESGTLEEFISKVFGKDDYGRFGHEWLRTYQVQAIEDRQELILNFNRKTLKNKYRTFVPEMVLSQYRGVRHPYLYQRKMTDNILDLFDIGYDRKSDTVTFPVRNETGECVFIARRSTKGKFFHYPSGAEKPLYGLYELRHLPYVVDEVWITESMFNCLTLWTHDIPAIALNGTGSRAQIEKLKTLPYRSYVVALDPDETGRVFTYRLKRELSPFGKLIFTVTYTDNRDINDLSNEECEQLIKTRHLM